MKRVATSHTLVGNDTAEAWIWRGEPYIGRGEEQPGQCGCSVCSGRGASTSNSRLLTSSKGVSNSTYCFRKLLKNQSWKPDCERAHCRRSSPGRYAGRAPRRMASQGWTTIRRTCLEIGMRVRESQLRCSRPMPRQQAELLQLAQRSVCSASKPRRARTSWRAVQRGPVQTVRVLCPANE